MRERLATAVLLCGSHRPAAVHCMLTHAFSPKPFTTTRPHPPNLNRFEFWRTAGEWGLHGITVPAEQGGLGLGYLHHCIAMEELSRASGSGGCWRGGGGCNPPTVHLHHSATDPSILWMDLWRLWMVLGWMGCGPEVARHATCCCISLFTTPKRTQPPSQYPTVPPPQWRCPTGRTATCASAS